MTLPIYSIAYDSPVPSDVLQPLLTALPADIREKAGRFRRWQDTYGCVLGKHLLRIALQEAGLSGALEGLQYTDYGRPYLTEGPDFNIAHSGTRVICVLDPRGRVGIDLEWVHDLPIEDFREQFSDIEWEAIAQDSSKATFFHYWTAKESIIKADGRGLNIPLNQLRVEYNSEIQVNNMNWRLRKLPFFADYICHIATEAPLETPVLRELRIGEILSAGRPANS